MQRYPRRHRKSAWPHRATIFAGIAAVLFLRSWLYASRSPVAAVATTRRTLNGATRHLRRCQSIKEPWYRVLRTWCRGSFLLPTCSNRSAFPGACAPEETLRVDSQSNTGRDRYDQCFSNQSRHSFPAGRRPRTQSQRPRTTRPASGSAAESSAASTAALRTSRKSLGLVAERLNASSRSG